MVAVAAVLLAVLLIRTQWVELLRVSSDSMSPTLCIGDIAVLTRLHAGAEIGHNDIVTFDDPATGARAIKRVVGLAGEKVAIEDAQLAIDGRIVDEPWVDHRTIDGVYFGPVTVPAGTVFLMGDHREVSVDSRQFGAVPVADLRGRLLTTLFGGC